MSLLNGVVEPFWGGELYQFKLSYESTKLIQVIALLRRHKISVLLFKKLNDPAEGTDPFANPTVPTSYLPPAPMLGFNYFTDYEDRGFVVALNQAYHQNPWLPLAYLAHVEHFVSLRFNYFRLYFVPLFDTKPIELVIVTPIAPTSLNPAPIFHASSDELPLSLAHPEAFKAAQEELLKQFPDLDKKTLIWVTGQQTKEGYRYKFIFEFVNLFYPQQVAYGVTQAKDKTLKAELLWKNTAQNYANGAIDNIDKEARSLWTELAAYNLVNIENVEPLREGLKLTYQKDDQTKTVEFTVKDCNETMTIK